MFKLFWNSLDTLKDIVNLITGWDDEFVLPTTVVNNKIKCLDYDMDSVVFQTSIVTRNYDLYEIHTHDNIHFGMLENI
jgi:hypothetical protein